MSGIVGIFHRDGRPVGASAVVRMMVAAAHRGPDGANSWCGGAIGLGHQQFRATASRVTDPQSLEDPSTCARVVFDGRLDNRADLIEQLGLVRNRSTDARIVLAAYDRWGRDCAPRLLGDFAFAVWDTRQQLVFCARDVMGARPFYYHLTDAVFVWGSDLRQVLASGCVGREPNEAMAGEYLSRSITSHEETLYRGLFRLPAAHTLTVEATRVSKRRYWRPGELAELRYKSDREYADHFSSVFGAAVRCRIPENGPVGAYLSGGLDSSSVVAAARADGCDVKTFSLVFPGTPDADESHFIDEMIARWTLDARKLVASPVNAVSCRERIRRRGDASDLPADLMTEPLRALVRDSGVRVVLTGVGGDHGFAGSLYHYADLLRAGRIVSLARQVIADSRIQDVGWAPSTLLGYGVRPLLPQVFRNLVRPAARQFGFCAPTPDWIDERFAARIGLAERLRPPATSPRTSSYGTRYVQEVFESGWPYLLLESCERSAAEHCLEERHPFFDRRVVEFATALPEAQRWQGRQTKYVLRQAMGGLLPDRVRQRTNKADISSFVVAAIEAVGGAEFLNDLNIASIGWVKPKRVAAMHAEMLRLFRSGDERYLTNMFPLWMICVIELWYCSLTEPDESGNELYEEARERQQVARGSEEVGTAEWNATAVPVA